MGPVEVLIILAILLLSFAVPAAIVVFAVRALRSDAPISYTPVVQPAGDAPLARCATCNAVYRADYVACPYCTRSIRPEGAIDVTQWSAARVTALLIATMWPLVYIFVFIAFVFGVVAISDGGSTGGPPPAFLALAGVHAFTMLVTMGLLVVYVIIVLKSPISSNAKVLWALAVVIGGMIAQPLAFYFLVWEPRHGGPKPQPPQVVESASSHG